VNTLRQTIFYDTKTRSFGKYDEDGTFLDNIPVSSDIKSVDGVQISGDKIFILDKKSEIIHRLSDNGFYESFYPAKNVTNFQFIDGKMLLVQNMIFMMNQINADDSRIIYLENPSQKVFKNEGFVYLLTSEELFRIPLR
jgi:hypothetical protein